MNATVARAASVGPLDGAELLAEGNDEGADVDDAVEENEA